MANRKTEILSQTDIDTLAQIRRGDVKAYENTFSEYYSTLCLFARNMVGDMDKARDIVQDVFAHVYANRSTLQINTSIKSYLFKCVYNASLNSLKQQKVYAHHHEYLKQNLNSIDGHDMLVSAELEERIRVTVEALPDQCRKIFEMNRYQGKKNGEIAGELGISVRTVETQISKALKALRANLTEFLTLLIIALAV
jgi:RNA polymerase sigma-70 factor, ECF subfamily